MIAKQIIPDLTNFDFSDVLNNICITTGTITDQNMPSPINMGNRVFSNLVFCDMSLYHNTSSEELFNTAILHGGLLKDDVGYFTDPAYYLILLDGMEVVNVKKYWLTDNTQSQMGKDETIGIPIQSVFSADTAITIDSGESVLHISVGGLDLTPLNEPQPEDYIEDNSSMSLWGWGYNSNGELGLGNSGWDKCVSSPVQIGTSTDYTQVICGFNHTLAIKLDNSLQSWGANFRGALGHNDVIDKSSPTQVGEDIDQKIVCAGNWHSLAIKTDGTLQSWGDNSDGELGLGDSGWALSRSSPTQIGVDTNQKDICFKFGHSLAIKDDGSLQAWGINSYGQLGVNDRINRSSPVQVGSDTDQDQLNSGSGYSFFIKTDGTIQTCGYNYNGQLGQNDVIHRSSPTQIGSSTEYKCITGGAGSSFAIKIDGTLQSWGRNYKGELGQSDQIQRSSPIQIGSDTNQEQISAFNMNCLAIKTGGTLWAQGYNNSGMLGLDSIADVSSPTQVGDLNIQKQISTLGQNTFAITVEKILIPPIGIDLGINGGYKIDKNLYRFNPVSGYQSEISGASDISSRFGHGICKYDNNQYILLIGGGTDQTVIDFQDCTCSKTIFTSVEQFQTPTQIELVNSNTGDTTQFGGGVLEEQLTGKASDQDFGDASTSGEDGLYLKVDHTTDIAGLLLDLTNQFSARCVVHLPDETTTIFDDSLTPPFQMDFAPDGTTVCVWSDQPKGTRIKRVLTFGEVSSDSQLFMQGSNYMGCLGLGTDWDHEYSPVQAGTDTDQKTIVTGSNQSMGLKTGGTIWCTGRNGTGQMCESGYINEFAQILDSTDQTLISAGGETAAAIKTDGTLQSWGSNYKGILGVNDDIHRSSPTQIGVDTDQKDVKVLGWNQMLALKTDGSLQAQGYNYYGQLGLNDIIDRSSPVQIGSSTYSKISGTENCGFAIKTDGSLQAQGYNDCGQLGQNDVAVSRSSPIQIGSSTWEEIACGRKHILAIRTNGSLQAWGNNYGALGTNELEHKSSPVQIGSGVNQSKIGTLTQSSFAIKTDGTLQSQGSNYNGILGLGDTVDRSSPTQIGSEEYWDSIVGGQTASHIGAINKLEV